LLCLRSLQTQGGDLDFLSPPRLPSVGPSLSRPRSRGLRDQGFPVRIKLGIFLEVEESAGRHEPFSNGTLDRDGGWRTSPAAKYNAPLQRRAEDKTGVPHFSRFSRSGPLTACSGLFRRHWTARGHRRRHGCATTLLPCGTPCGQPLAGRVILALREKVATR